MENRDKGEYDAFEYAIMQTFVRQECNLLPIFLNLYVKEVLKYMRYEYIEEVKIDEISVQMQRFANVIVTIVKKI